MNIVDVRTHVVSVVPGGSGDLGSLRIGWVLVEVETEDGLVGVGECSNYPNQGDVVVARTIDIVRDWLIGQDADHIERIWQQLYRRFTYLGSRGLITTVISGIDIALWDLKGKRLGTPVYDLLGGPVREAVPLYTHPGVGSPEATAEFAAELVGQGYDAIKLDPFVETRPRHTDYVGGVITKPGLRAGAEIIEAVRARVGNDVEILIDMHGNYNVATAVDAIRALEPYGITWFEEPLPPESIAALVQVRRQTGANLCVGERLHTRFDVLPVLEAGAVNYLMPDVCWTGGISELRKIAALAEARYVPISPHTAQGPIQLIASAHVARCIPNFYRLEISSRWQPVYDAAVRPGLEIHDGELFLGDRPGLGVELDLDWVRAHPNPDRF